MKLSHMIILSAALIVVGMLVANAIGVSAHDAAERAYLDCIHKLGAFNTSDVDEMLAISDVCGSYLP